MDNTLLLGIWRMMIRLPPGLWQSQLAKIQTKWDLSFMTPEHHLVRDFVVREMPRFNRPLPPELIADELRLPLEKVRSVLDELEEHMTFLFRDPEGSVRWAYPVTVDETPHEVVFSTGERLHAA